MLEGQKLILIQNTLPVMKQKTFMIIPENNFLNVFLLKII